MDIMERIREFLDNEELVNFFEIKGYKPSIEKGWFRLINTKNNTVERMGVFIDPNNKRIRFKGERWAFSINRDNNNNIYLDHLLIGNVKEEEFDFSFRHNINKDNKNEIIVKLVDDKNVKHTYRIKENSISIERQSVKDKMPKYQNKNYNIKDYAKQEDEYEYKHFHIFKDENGNIKLLNPSKENFDNCLKEFLILEKKYISITSYIEKRINFLSEVISTVTNSDTKLYEIKRKTSTTKPYEKAITEETKTYKFTKKKNNQ